MLPTMAAKHMIEVETCHKLDQMLTPTIGNKAALNKSQRVHIKLIEQTSSAKISVSCPLITVHDPV